MSDLRKRRNTKQIDGQSQTRKKFDFTNISGYRFLIPSKAGGAMIGKGGEIIKRLRSQFSCRIIVPDSQGPERMVIMDGDIDVIIDCWNGALRTVKEFVNAKDCDFKTPGNKLIEDEDEIDLRLVVHESQAGALIGKGGERIRHLIDTHKMTIIKVYQTFCPNSTDRVVRLVSVQENLLECVRSMLKLLENQIINGVRNDYDPDNFDETAASNYGGYLSKESRGLSKILSPMSFDVLRETDSYIPRPTVFDRVSHFDDDSGGSNTRNNIVVNELFNGIIRLHSDSGMQTHTSRVALPIHLVSSVIGFEGHRLDNIKRDSGAQIQLDEARLNEREELFLIRGTADEIYKAQCLMQLCVQKFGDMGQYGY